MGETFSAEQIRELRHASDMTQEALAGCLGVSLSSVCRWEQNRSRPSRLAMAALKKLSEKLQADRGVL
jgi:DNA-binding transcriptional regulator YiaG